MSSPIGTTIYFGANVNLYTTYEGSFFGNGYTAGFHHNKWSIMKFVNGTKSVLASYDLEYSQYMVIGVKWGTDGKIQLYGDVATSKTDKKDATTLLCEAIDNTYSVGDSGFWPGMEDNTVGSNGAELYYLNLYYK